MKLLKRFLGDRSGNYAVITALLSPILIGIAGLATEGGLWLYDHQTLQGAADSAALSAATLASTNGSKVDPNAQADGVVAKYGYVAGTNGTTVTVNRPPTSGNYTTNAQAIEVIVRINQARLLSSIYSSSPVTIAGRAVALPGNNGSGCVLSLNATAGGGTTIKGTSDVTLVGCSVYDNSSSSSGLVNGGSSTITADSVNVVGGISGGAGISAPNGINTGAAAATDPYASVALPSFSGCAANSLSIHDTETLNPGVYCNGLQLSAGANVTLNPGIYYIDRGSFSVNGGATISGTGVTIVFTSSTGSHYATATINGGATVALTAPTSGPLQGIVIYGDRTMPTSSSFSFNGGAGQILSGAVYVPHGSLQYAGGASSSANCTQIIADTVTFTGNANLAINCSALGTQSIGAKKASLVE